jgi:superfamily II DNA/RNA helicase
MHRTGRVGRGKDVGQAFVIYKHGIDNILSRLTKKGINFKYQLLNNGVLTEKPLELHFKKPRRFDHETNEKIKQII